MYASSSSVVTITVAAATTTTTTAVPMTVALDRKIKAPRQQIMVFENEIQELKMVAF